MNFVSSELIQEQSFLKKFLLCLTFNMLDRKVTSESQSYRTQQSAGLVCSLQSLWNSMSGEKMLFPLLLKNHMAKFCLFFITSCCPLSFLIPWLSSRRMRKNGIVGPLIYPATFNIIILYKILEGRFELLVKGGPAVVSSFFRFLLFPYTSAPQEHHSLILSHCPREAHSIFILNSRWG